MMRWLWRDHAVSVDVHDNVERAFQGPAAVKSEETPKTNGK